MALFEVFNRKKWPEKIVELFAVILDARQHIAVLGE